MLREESFELHRRRGAPNGNRNRLRHGRYSADSIARRKQARETIRSAARAMLLTKLELSARADAWTEVGNFTIISAMNKIVTAAEANRNFSKLLKEVRKGNHVEVTSHGDVVARIIPAESPGERARRDKAWEALLKRLQNQPAMNSGPWSREEAYDEDM